MSTETEKTVEQEAAAGPVVQKSTAREYLESLVVTVILALFGTTFLVQAFKIPASSMEDSLLIGDHLMVDKVSYGPEGIWGWMLPYKEIRRDQIIVFRYPRDPGTYFVKRIVGIPGDRLRLEDKQVVRNGIHLEEPHAVHKSRNYEEFRDNFPNFDSGGGFPDWMLAVPDFTAGEDIVVPDGVYFVMGDNRDLSSDSRYWGFVPRENIVGNPLILYWSFESSSEEYRETGLASSIGRLFDVLIHFPQKTRWRRMFRLVR